MKRIDFLKINFPKLGTTCEIRLSDQIIFALEIKTKLLITKKQRLCSDQYRGTST
jgi:hypothetical protein